QICAQELKLPVSQIHVVSPDTDTAPFGFGTFGSRVTQVTGTAVMRAAKQALAKLLAIASERLGVPESELGATNGEVYVRSASPNQKLTYKELIHMNLYRQGGEAIQVLGEYDPPTVMADPHTAYGNVALSYTFAAQAAEVEVDTETGQVSVIETYIAD